ncbi:hypothetical protein BTA51_11045 [Hahella sp. CCB-MM4]|nr:hypothetical protein BTA51_11045 [Hahella sp. CCB-MM4]
MRSLQFAWLWIALAFLSMNCSAADESSRAPWYWPFYDEIQTTQVVEPYVEIRTGPGRGFPVFYVAEKDEWIELIKRKTDWIKVRVKQGEEGWVHRDDIEKTLDATGENVAFSDPRYDDYDSRTWEAGVMTGSFGGAAVNTLYAGYQFTPNLSAEVGVSQVLGDFSQVLIGNINLVHQPFPQWRISPFFTLGTGVAYIKPKATLVREENRDEDSTHYGLGLRFYLTDRYFLRAEYREYVVMTTRDENEEAEEWKIGLSVFF